MAGVAAGSAAGYAGAAPSAKLVSVDVLNDDGMAWTSDVIAGADWILQHKDDYDIRVANFSLTTSVPSSFTVDPLDQAVERLWFAGVVVVAAAGNYGAGAAGDVKYAPANDPFVITVGAADLAGTADPSDDFAAPWSIYGSTYDGFHKPELGAPGRYMIGAVPTSATLTSERPGNVVAPGYMQLSGTSFAAPVVSGAVAHILARHPEYTPDQVKGALMVTSRPTSGTDWSLGVGEVNAVRAATFHDPPNPNAALEPFVVSDPSGGSLPVFDAASWNSTVQSEHRGTARRGTAPPGTAPRGTARRGTARRGTVPPGTAPPGTAIPRPTRPPRWLQRAIRSRAATRSLPTRPPTSPPTPSSCRWRRCDLST